MKAAKPLTEILEKEWDATLFQASKGLAPLLGYRSYHTLRSKGSSSGFPDRTLWKDRHLFAELKRELTGAKSEDANRRPSDKQRVVLDGLARAGAEVYVWRPSDLDEISRILGRPWTFFPGRLSATGVPAWWDETNLDPAYSIPPHLLIAGDGRWVPRSIWIPSVGRADEAGIV